MSLIKCNDSDWLGQIPITENAVSIVKYAELANFLYNYTHQTPACKIKTDVIYSVLELNGLIKKVSGHAYKVTQTGEKYVIIIEGQPFLKTDGQIYIRDYLLEHGFKAVKITKPLKPFAITEEQLNKYEFTEEPVVLTYVINKINQLIDASVYQKLPVRAAADFLVDAGMLDIVRCDNGRYFRKATQKGNKEGIYYREYTAVDGNIYMSNVYDKNGQFFILDNMQKICQFNSGERTIRDDRLKGVSAEDITTEEPEVIKYTCKDCMDFRNGGCFGADEICGDFRFAYTYSAKEVESWPEEGDASYIRRNKRT